MWEQIRANRRRSLLLIGGMLIVLLAMGYAGGELLLGYGGGPLGLLVAFGLWLVQMLVYWVAAESIMLNSVDARELSFEDSPRLFNIVEEIKIASGLPKMPKLYLIDSHSPNAFAIGRREEKSAIAVTTGLLYRLNRDELQGVIAHEIGHLRNRDVEFMTLAAAILGTIIMLQELIWRAMRMGVGRTRSRASSRGGGAPALIFFAIALLVAVVAPLVVRLLYYACSRSREYLADACSAQYTRYPDGLASALDKIQRAAPGLVVSKAVAPMFIVNPLRDADAEPQNVFSTHPPTSERIRVLRAMAGAGIAEYERAFRVAGGKSIIGAQTLQTATAIEKRGPSDEGPVENRSDARATFSRLNGYIEVNCDCGLQMSIPNSYERDEVVCIRCGSKHKVPAASERIQRQYEAIVAATEPSRKPAGKDAPPITYTRKGTPVWESFRCTCGATVQLSPSFSGARTFCRKCERQIDVIPASPAAV